MRTLLLTLTTCLLALPAQAKYSGGTGEPNDPYQIATAADLIALGETLSGIGAAGDSLTDEYSQRGAKYGDSSALCWVDLLGRLRGPTSALPELTFGDYQTSSMGSPRYRGYSHNWALAGADTATLLSQGQHTGLASQIRQGQVQYVAVFIGSNDFYPAYQALYSQTMPIPGPDGRQCATVPDYVNSIIARYTTALDAVSNASAKIVMATVADHGSLPSWIKDFPDAGERHYVTDVVMAVNDKLKTLATERKLPIVDMFELVSLFYVDSTPSNVGGVSIFKTVAPTPDARYAVLPDGFHPGTIWQGLLANAFLEACNRTYKTSFTPLSDREILTAAGLAHLASPRDSFFDIRPYVNVPAWARYSGGTGEPNDPYQIATAEDLMLLGQTPEDYDKHFILTADIDLDPNLPGRRVFGISSFGGVFNGNGHTISRLRLPLFGQLESGAEVKDLGVVDVNIVGAGTGVGALVGSNGEEFWDAGGGVISRCYSTGVVSGEDVIGGLVGINYHNVTNCYSTTAVRGGYGVGGLVGVNYGTVAQSYSIGEVNGDDHVGGLVGNGQRETGCFWDTQTSNQPTRVWSSGTGKTTAEMQDIQTYLSAGWDFVGETENGTSEIWRMPEGGGYPVLARFSGYIPPGLQGAGTSDDPYMVSNVLELGAMVYYSSYAHYQLAASIDLHGIHWGTAVVPWFAGVFDGNDATISQLTVMGGSYLGLFGQLAASAEIKNLAVVDVNITGSGDCVGGLVGSNGSYYFNESEDGWHYWGGAMARCCSTGVVAGDSLVGGLVGWNGGDITQCHSVCAVTGDSDVGGLVGCNDRLDDGRGIALSYSAGPVDGSRSVGGLVGRNWNPVDNCYSTGAVTGDWEVGGLMGSNTGVVTRCYATGPVRGNSSLGGFVGSDHAWGACPSPGATACIRGWFHQGDVTTSFWDIQTSGQATSAGGTGKTTAEMQMASTFINAGWDFVGETANGTEDIWWIDEGKDYPRLWWEAAGEPPP